MFSSDLFPPDHSSEITKGINVSHTVRCSGSDTGMTDISQSGKQQQRQPGGTGLTGTSQQHATCVPLQPQLAALIWHGAVLCSQHSAWMLLHGVCSCQTPLIHAAADYSCMSCSTRSCHAPRVHSCPTHSCLVALIHAIVHSCMPCTMCACRVPLIRAMLPSFMPCSFIYACHAPLIHVPTGCYSVLQQP